MSTVRQYDQQHTPQMSELRHFLNHTKDTVKTKINENANQRRRVL